MAIKVLDSQGLKYYDSLVKLELAKKQNVIEDLATIKSNAETGANLATKVGGIAEGAQVNVIETVKVNNEALQITGKAVNIDLTGKADKATSLAGYGITDAYTRTETETLVNNKIKDIVDIDGGDIDKLAEIAAWIKDNQKGAAKIIADVAALQTSKQDVISDLATIRSDAEAGKNYATNHASDETGAQVNKIETVKVNGVALQITDKAVDIDLAVASVKFSDTQTAAINSGITSTKVSTYDGYAQTLAGKLDSTDLSALTNQEIYDLIYPTT